MDCGGYLDVDGSLDNGLLTYDSVIAWENEHGHIQAGDIVLLNYGWFRKWNVGPEGAAFTENWPGIAYEAADYLRNKKIKAIGTDALSIDIYGSEDFPSHYVFLESEILIIENLNNLSALPDFSYFIGLLLKVREHLALQ